MKHFSPMSGSNNSFYLTGRQQAPMRSVHTPFDYACFDNKNSSTLFLELAYPHSLCFQAKLKFSIVRLWTFKFIFRKEKQLSSSTVLEDFVISIARLQLGSTKSHVTTSPMLRLEALLIVKLCLENSLFYF